MAGIAIIGTGISGLAAAYFLHQKHRITLYEKENRPGGHTRTRIVEHQGKRIPVDTGFIVYNERNYPNLTQLFARLGVPVQKSAMNFAITLDGGRLEWGSASLNSVFGQRRNLFRPAFHRMLADIFRFNRRAYAWAQHHPEATLADMLEALHLGETFRRDYILPMGGAIWSCPPQQMLAFPALTFTQFLHNHGLLTVTDQPQWYTVTGGAQNYIDLLTAGFTDRFRLGCAAQSVLRENGGVTIVDNHGGRETFDHVILACHADQAVSILKDARADELATLSAFSYQNNVAYLHNDPRFMPRRRRCWASWVYHSHESGTEPSIGVTYWMNALQGIDPAVPLFVTLNPDRPIPPQRVFDVHSFMHPVFTREAVAAQQRLPQLQGQQNTWFAGAYHRYGFHEDGLASVLPVVKALGGEIPWH